jgi:hypothetical protein
MVVVVLMGPQVPNPVDLVVLVEVVVVTTPVVHIREVLLFLDKEMLVVLV